MKVRPRAQARWFGAIDLLGVAGLVALYEPLLPLIRPPSCMGSLGAFLVFATVIAALAVCGIALLARPKVGGSLCLLVGIITACWATAGLLHWATREAYETGSISARLLQTGIVFLLPLQVVPGWLVLRSAHRAGTEPR